jgi:hypothetical protein
MYCRILPILVVGVYCLVAIATNCTAADKVVVIPMGNSLFSGDQYHTISNAAFTPDSNTTEYVRPVQFGTSSGYLELQNSLAGFVASVNLPDGAIISQLSTYIEEFGMDCTMTFEKYALSDHQMSVISDSTDSDNLLPDQYSPIHVDIADEEIDNQNFQYLLTWECTGLGLHADHLYAVRIKYRLR